VKIFGFNLFGGERKAITAADVRAELLAGGESKSGARVSWKTALEVTTALACARVIAEGLAQVPFKLFREAGNKKVPAVDHPLYSLLADRPNDWQTSFEFREQLALHLVFCGDAIVWKNKVGGKFVELLPYEPNCVTIKRDGWNLGYQVTTDQGRVIPVLAEEIWHLRGPSWNGWKGLEGVRLAREALGLALATEEHGSRMFSNGARLGGILSTDKDLRDPEQRKALRDSWEETHGGNRNAFKTGLLWGGLKWQATGMQNDQAQLTEQRRFQVEEICRAFRVMPIMVGYSDKAATYASAEQMFLAHVVYTLGPWYARLEQSANANLLTPKEREQGYYFKFLPQGLMRGAHKDRAEYFAKALGSGGSPAWMTPDEVRALDELNPMGGAAAELPKPTNVGGGGTTPKGADNVDATS
jgi:HK97 family phage portal protein